MKTLPGVLKNPLTQKRDARDRERIRTAFPDLLLGGNEHYLALRRYLDNRPDKFFDRTVYIIYLRWLQGQKDTDSQALRGYFSKFNTEINRALLFLREINAAEMHDGPLEDGSEYDEFELIRRIDKQVHPIYLRLVEAVLAPLIHPVAFFSRINRNKGTDGLDIWSVVHELRGQPEECLVLPYESIIRNGIAHGGISFLQNEICYRDSRGNEETFHTRYVLRLLDDLVDTCNGLATALKVFLVVSLNEGYIPLRELLVEELQEETRTPWWSIEGCIETEIPGKSQLIVYARPDSRRYAMVQYSTIQSGILSESFIPGYDRYFVSLRSPEAWAGFAAFDGRKLRELREAGISDLSEYKGVLEDEFIFYVTRPALPAFLGRLDTIVKSFKIQLPVFWRQLREDLGIPHIVCRNAAVHRNSWGGVLRADIVIEGLDDQKTIEVIRKNRGRIIRTAKRHARRADRLNLATHLPLGYAQVNVFRRDYRRRRLSGFGLGDDLVCTVRFQRLRRIRVPDILDSTVETTGKWRIAWNKAWLEATGQ